MTPPRLSFHIPELKLNEELPSPFFSELLNTPPAESLALSSFTPSYRILEKYLSWNPPKLWLEKKSLKEKQNPTWTGAEIFAFVTNILTLVETLDAEASGIVANGGQGGCRYEEMAKREEVEKLYESCLVKFEDDTRASVNFQVRKKAGSQESIITRFQLLYDKSIYKDVFPDNQVRVQGFQFTPIPEKEIPFNQTVSPLSDDGYSLRYKVNPSGMLSVPLIGYPIFKFEAEGNDKLDLTHDFLLSLGIDKAEYYSQVGAAHFKIPQTVRGFMTLLGHTESDDEKIPVVNINKLRGNPPLFDWLSFQNLHWVSRFREGTLEIPHLGYLSLNRQSTLQKFEAASSPEEKTRLMEESGRLEIRNQTSGMQVRLSNLEIAEAKFKIASQEIEIRNMKVGNLAANLPAFLSFIQQIKSGRFPGKEFKVKLQDVVAEEIWIRDSNNQITSHFKMANFRKLILSANGGFEIQELKADAIEVKAPDFSTSLNIQSVVFPRVFLKRTDSQASLFIPSLHSVGSIGYRNLSGLSFETQGSSQLENIHWDYIAPGSVKASLQLSGKIDSLKLQQNSSLDLNLQNAQLAPSPLSMELRVNPESALLESLQYDCNLQILKTELTESQLGKAALAASTLRNAQLRLFQAQSKAFEIPEIHFEGELDLHLSALEGSEESFNIPGLSLSGGIYDVAFQGKARFQSNRQGWIFENSSQNPEDKISASGKIRNLQLIHDPHQVPGNYLQQWPHHEVVKSEMLFESADLSIEGVERIAFSQEGFQDGGSHFSNLEIQGIRLDHLKAGGVLWAKFPLFYYMRGVFPEIGDNQENPVVQPSFAKLNRFSIRTNPDGKSATLLEGFESEIYEVQGQRAYAKVNFPYLKISPGEEKLIDTGDQVNRVNLYLIDKLRGGWIQLRSVDRPLLFRRSRIIPSSNP